MRRVTCAFLSEAKERPHEDNEMSQVTLLQADPDFACSVSGGRSEAQSSPLNVTHEGGSRGADWCRNGMPRMEQDNFSFQSHALLNYALQFEQNRNLCSLPNGKESRCEFPGYIYTSYIHI